MTTIFTTKKTLPKRFSKRILGMESLESREMLSVNPLGVDHDYDSPDYVQTNAAPQNFSTEAAGDITNFSVNTGDPTSVAFDVTLEASVLDSTPYSVYYSIQNTSSFNADSTWTLIETEQTSSNSITFNDFDTSSSLATTNAGKYIFFGVAAGDTTPISGGFATTGTDKVASTNFVQIPPALESNSVATASGVTTNAATLTWTKPTTYTETGTTKNIGKVNSYTLTYNSDGTTHSVSATELKTKTTWTLTGLEAAGTVSYTITANVDEKAASGVSSAKGVEVLVDSGSIPLVTVGDAADVTVGPPTEIKATYAKASSTKPASVKVTWKAPANYTGGYVVTLHDVTASTSDIVKQINPGEKLEFTVAVGTTAGTNVVDKTRYEVIVTTTAENDIESTPTYVNVGEVSVTSVKPNVPATVTPANSHADLPGGTTVTLVADTSGNAATTVGYYVGIANSAPAQVPDLAKLVYVPEGTALTLKGVENEKVYAYSVAADGTVSATPKESAAALTGSDMVADIATPLLTSEYTAANDVTNVTATADSTVKNKYTVKWTAATDVTNIKASDGTTVASGDTKYEVTGYRVTAKSKDGLATIAAYVTKAKQADGAVFENLNLGTEYTFKVEALITKSLAITTSWNGATTTSEISSGATKTATVVAKVTVTDDITGITESSNVGTNVALTLAGAKAGSNYIVTVTDNNKAVLYTGAITGTSTTTFDLKADGGLTLTPKAKYTVTVQTVGSVPGTLSKGKSVNITAADFVSATLKDARATTVNSVKLTVTAPTKGAGASDKYYIEYTNVVDAKSKPDWNAAKVYTTTSDPEAVTGGTNITIGQLDPNSQYFFRIVTVDKTWITGGSSVGWDDMTKVSTSKELKVKTAAVPLPTIAKNGFTLDTQSAFGLKLVGNSMQRVDALTNKNVLSALKPTSMGDPLYVYTLIASLDSKTDKATGKLLGAETVESSGSAVALTIPDSNNTSATDKKVTDLTGEATFAEIFTALSVDDTNFSSVKGLNVQIQVDVYYGQGDNSGPNPSSDHFTVYSKASKIALPKWFV